MQCSKPGLIRDEDLLAYLAEEEERPLVAEHRVECRSCTARLAAYRRMDLALTSKLYRCDCPPSQVLGEYQFELLGQVPAAVVKNHLARCKLCAAEVAALTGFLANDPVLTWRAAEPAPASPRNYYRAGGSLEHQRAWSRTGVRRIAAALVAPQPRLAYQRDVSQQAQWPRRFTAEDLSISLQLERVSGRRDSLRLLGFVTRRGAALEVLRGIQVQLLAHNGEGPAGGMCQTQSIDELGNFIFSPLAPATCTLELELPESIVVIDQLPVVLQD